MFTASDSAVAVVVYGWPAQRIQAQDHISLSFRLSVTSSGRSAKQHKSFKNGERRRRRRGAHPVFQTLPSFTAVQLQIAVTWGHIAAREEQAEILFHPAGWVNYTWEALYLKHTRYPVFAVLFGGSGVLLGFIFTLQHYLCSLTLPSLPVRLNMLYFEGDLDWNADITL